MSRDFPALHPKIVLGIAAHPDDLDFGVAGSMAKWVRGGAKAYYLILTDGSKGSDDTSVSPRELIETRRQEQRQAAKILGVSDVIFLEYEDGALEVTMQLKKDISRVIRQLKPDVAYTMDPSMLYYESTGFINHTDHRAAGQATIDAVYPLARDHLSFPELFADGLQPHKVATLLLSNFERQNYFEDITESLPQKLRALAAHESQMPDIDATRKFVTDNARQAGTHAGCEFAEGFLRLDLMP